MWCVRGALLWAAGAAEEAERDWAKAETLAPAHPGPFAWRARTTRRAVQIDAAIASALARALGSLPQSVWPTGATPTQLEALQESMRALGTQAENAPQPVKAPASNTADQLASLEAMMQMMNRGV